MRNKIAFLVALIAISLGVTAQNGTITPYSRFGYGMLRDNATAAQQMMGGVGYAMNSGRQINVMNPASYARVDSLTFLWDMGVDISNQWTSEATKDNLTAKEKHTGGGLNYVTMQFPLAKGIGMSIGVLPYSAVGYAFGSAIDNGYSNHGGSGSINKLYAGIAIRLFSGLSLGLNASYLFGSTINDTYAITDNGSTSLFENELSVRDWHCDAGVQYTWNIGKTDFLTFGLTYAPKKYLHGTIRQYHYDVNTTNTDKGVEANEEWKTGKDYGMSESLGVGFAYRRGDRWLAEADFTYQPWKDVKFNGAEGRFDDRYKIAVGGYYQPAVRGNYLKRIQYRLGGHFTRDYIVVKGNNLREYGVSCGFGLPVPGFKSIVSLGLEWKRRQAHPQPMVKEDYFNISLGFNINEMWFRKSKIY